MNPLPEKVNEIRTRFETLFGRPPTTVVRSPGRVNLIGEHTDYNEGFVLPVAIDRAILIAAAPRHDREVHLYALNFDEGTEFSLNRIERDEGRPWSNYQRGVTLVLEERGLPLVGMDACIWGDVPIGSGLSSSAAVEVATAFAFQILSGFELGRVEMALLCQRAENEFVGVQCGIMDQFIACLGRRDHALLIDCRSLDYKHVPLPPEAAIVVCDTMVRRGLVDSEYNARRRECAAGARLLGVKALRDVPVEEFERRRGELPEVVRRRCRHVIYENRRTLDSVEALRRGNLAEFGRLMNESHRSLRDDYEVSCRELDVMVEAAQRVEGVYGSRMTGAGFGGCTVSLVEAEAVEGFRDQVAQDYEAATGIEPSIYVCRAEDGVGVQSSKFKAQKG
jgi:galactokinase